VGANCGRIERAQHDREGDGQTKKRDREPHGSKVPPIKECLRFSKHRHIEYGLSL
jgi:hypothetical protein